MLSEDGSENGGAETGGRNRGQKQGAEAGGRDEWQDHLVPTGKLLVLEHDRREVFGVNCLRKTYTTSASHWFDRLCLAHRASIAA